MCPTSPACGCCCRIRKRSIRSSPPTTPIPSPRRPSPPARRRLFEFQRLHGMGEALYDEVRSAADGSTPLPHLCAGRRARGPALLSGAPPARERRQHLVRQPPRRRRGAHREDPARSGGGGRSASAASRAPCCRRPRGHLLARAAEQPRHRADRADGAGRVSSPRWPTRSNGSFDAGPIVGGEVRPGRGSRASCCARTTAASASARCTSPIRRPSRRPCARHRRPAPGTGWAAEARAKILRRKARSLRARPRAPDGGDGARGRQDAGERPGGSARGRSTSCATTPTRRAAAVRRAARRCKARRRAQHADLRGARRLRLHQPVEFPAGDLHRPGGGRARRRQSGARQAGRADAHHRLPRRRSCCTRPACRPTCCSCCRAAGDGGRGAGARSARRRRRLHRLATTAAWAIQTRSPLRGRRHGALHRRDRRPQRHDRRLHARCPSR